jgi:tetratricopeptide (TPR) repeat protein
MVMGLSVYGQANPSDPNYINLAHSYYNKGEYDKALSMFQGLYEKTKAVHYLDYYINCLVQLKNYNEAEKVLKQVMRNDKNPVYAITLGFIYKSKHALANAQKTFNGIIDNLQPNMGSINSVANALFNRSEFEYAEKTYLKGRQLIPGEMFRNYISTVYAYMRNYEKMMEEYLAMLRDNENELANIQGRLSSLMRFDFDNTLRNLIKREVLKNIQASPNTLVYNRLLIWILVQEENYSQAMTQSIALDRRTRSEEGNVLLYAKSSADQSLYDVALTGINYLLERKPEAQNINEAKQEKVRVEYQKLINSPKKAEQAEASMMQMFESFFAEFGFNTRTAPLVRDYAHYLAFYRGNADKAFEVLENALKSRDMDANQYTLLRIELADLNVYADYLWEASLQYSQIIETNKNNPLGDEVKMKRARLSYFMGEIEWAKAQLDVLKASTSKLIANDAMELALLIAGNYELDSILEPIQIFAQADLFLFRNQDQKAFEILEKLRDKYPGHTLNDQIILRKAYISERSFNFAQAAEYYKKVVDQYGSSIGADDALFKLAQVTEKQLNDPEMAKTYYQKILTDYPGSIYVADARKKFRTIRGDFPVNDPFDMLDASKRPSFSE